MTTEEKTFCISHGLRGCYMPDGEPWVLSAYSISAVIDALTDECNFYSYHGETMQYDVGDAMATAAAAWEAAHADHPPYLPYCIPMAAIPYDADEPSYDYGVFISVGGID